MAQVPAEDSPDNTVRRRRALTPAERMRNYRARKSGEHQVINDVQPGQDIPINLVHATRHFKKILRGDQFGSACNVCDRLWYNNLLKRVKQEHIASLEPEFEAADTFRVCASCYQSLNRGKMPPLSTSNGFKYPPKPQHLPPLDPISARLISPRIQFMAIRRLRRDGQYGIVGQVINIPVDVSTMVNNLPRQLDDDYSFNVSIKKKLVHKSSYLTGFVKKRVIKEWLEYLVQKPLYRRYNITIDWTNFNKEVDNIPSPDIGDEIVEELSHDGKQSIF